MKNIIKIFTLVFITGILFTSCERVAPNYQGVLMENYGKDGKSDYSEVKGRVNTMGPGTELFQVPMFEQRADFEDKVLHLKAADNSEFSSKPMYSIKVIEGRAVDVVFENSNLSHNDDFLKSIEDNILEPKIYDIMKEASRSYTTDTLMANGGSLRFEQHVQELVKSEFEKKGFELLTFSSQLEFTEAVKNRIDVRNEVNTNISVLDQQIAEQKKKNELAALQSQYNQILYTPAYLQALYIDAMRWSNNRIIITDGKTPVMLNGQ